MDKKIILILLGIIAVVGIFFLMRNNDSQLSLTRQIDAQTIEFDTEVPCSDVSDCAKIQDFPSDGYCEATCRMKLNTADLYPKDLSNLGGQ